MSASQWHYLPPVLALVNERALHGYTHLHSVPLEAWLHFQDGQPPSLPYLGLSFPSKQSHHKVSCCAGHVDSKLYNTWQTYTVEGWMWTQTMTFTRGPGCKSNTCSKGRGHMVVHLERLNPDMPEREASSMSGVTIFSVISVSTVKVGSTMKSMKPEQKCKHSQEGEIMINVKSLHQRSQTNSF